MKRLKHQRFIIINLLLFSILSVLVITRAFTSFDISSRLYVQLIISKKYFLPIALFFDQVFQLRVVVTIFAILLFFFARNGKGLRIALVFLVMFGIEVLAKLFIPQHTLSGPYMKNFSAPFFFGEQYGTLEIARYPFPSGHVARTIFFSFLFMGLFERYSWFRTNRWLVSTVLICLNGIVALSRIYLFRHWLTDVLGGILLGTGFGMIVYDVVISYRSRYTKDY